VKKFAFAAMIAGGLTAALFATPLDAKSGGGGGGGFSGHRGGGFRAVVRPNIGPLARRGHPIPRNIGPLAGRHLAQHHRHHHHRGNGGYGYGYSDYAYGDYAPYAAAPVVSQDVSDLYAPPPPQPLIAHPVIRTLANSKDVCSSEYAHVPASSGGETTVTILRC
jgi:hypothetical protein